MISNVYRLAKDLANAVDALELFSSNAVVCPVPFYDSEVGGDQVFISPAAFEAERAARDCRELTVRLDVAVYRERDESAVGDAEREAQETDLFNSAVENLQKSLACGRAELDGSVWAVTETSGELLDRTQFLQNFLLAATVSVEFKTGN